MPTLSIFGPRGQRPSDRISEIERAVQVTAADTLFALERQKSRILRRTESGVDYQGVPFAQYSDKGPYYYTPGAKGSTVQQQKSTTTRLIRRLGSGTLSRTGQSIRFDGGYREFKLSGLGRSTVDLRGPSAPHMLQAMVIKVDDVVRGDVGPTEQSIPAFVATLGFYSEEAARAKGHNEGVPERHLPQRRFFDVSDQDQHQIAQDIAERRVRRVSEK